MTSPHGSAGSFASWTVGGVVYAAIPVFESWTVYDSARTAALSLIFLGSKDLGPGW